MKLYTGMTVAATLPENPTKISPKKRNIEDVSNLTCNIPEYSYTILVVSK